MNKAILLDKQRNSIENTISLVLISIFLAFFPWDSVRAIPFADTVNYLERMNFFNENPSYLFGQLEQPLFYLNEPLWAFLLQFLSLLPIEHSISLKILTAFTTYLIIKYVCENSSIFFAFLIAINPIFIDLVASQQRSAVAFSIYLYLFSMRENRVKWLFFILSLAIHSSMLIMLGIDFIIRRSLDNKISINLKLLFVVFSALLLSLIIYYGYGIVLSYIGDRRANANYVSVSILYSAFWMFILLMLIVYSFFYPKLMVGYFQFTSVFLLTIFISFSLLSFYSSRFIAYALPFLFISVFKIRYLSHYFLTFCLVLNTIIQYVYWSGSNKFIIIEF